VGFWLKTDSDVIMQIVTLAKKVSNLARVYVKGHQDEKRKHSNLTQPELFNIDADVSETQMCHEMIQLATKVIIFPASEVNVYIHNQHISSSLQSILATKYNTEDYWAYLEEKFNWTTSTYNLIAWDSYHKTLKMQPTQQHKQLMKYLHNWLSTGHEAHRNDENEDH
jgi:hypothetical protein